MAGLFGGGTQPPPPPKPVRMPTERDPAVIAAGLRAREQLARSSGRSSTVLTDVLRSVTGSKGKLGT